MHLGFWVYPAALCIAVVHLELIHGFIQEFNITIQHLFKTDSYIFAVNFLLSSHCDAIRKLEDHFVDSERFSHLVMTKCGPRQMSEVPHTPRQR